MKMSDYSDVVTVDQLDAALRQGAFEAVAHYLGDDFAFREENPDVVAGIRARGWPQTAIFVVRAPSSINANGDINRAHLYGYPAGSQLYLDIEPVVFDNDPAGWARACDAWAPVIRAAGYKPGVYGVDRTCAACGNLMDYIWRAVPGMCDPAAAGPQDLNPAYKPGRRMVQCGNGLFGGVEMDINFSQFSITTGGFTVADSENITAIYQEIMPPPPNGPGTPGNVTASIIATEAAVTAMQAQLNAMQAKLDALAGGQLPAPDVQAIADAVEQRLAAQFNK